MYSFNIYFCFAVNVLDMFHAHVFILNSFEPFQINNIGMFYIETSITAFSLSLVVIYILSNISFP